MVENTEDRNSVIAHSPTAIPSRIAPAPLIKFKTDPTRKVLVLDIDETLVHSNFFPQDHYDFCFNLNVANSPCPIYVATRPGLAKFLQKIRNIFDVYFFTASIQEYSCQVVRFLAPNFPQSKILNREHCKISSGFFTKDLSIFDRNESSVILVDNCPASSIFQPQNGIIISSWLGDPNDNELLGRVLPLLESCNKADDVRTVISAQTSP